MNDRLAWRNQRAIAKTAVKVLDFDMYGLIGSLKVLGFQVD